MVFIMRQVQKRQQAEVGGSVVRAAGLMQGNTEMDRCGAAVPARRTTRKTVGRRRKWCVCGW